MNVAEKINNIEKQYIRTDLPKLEIGDTIKMRIKVTEADKSRVHPYEGTVIKKSGGSNRETFTVRKLSFGEGVERTFPVHSPVIESIQIVSKGRIKRAKLYYLRDRIGKKARVKKRVTRSS
ncbi:MAG: 50S ribosomal protein L19 [Candidatus Omnitrophica bacterium]|nr:50S ribosomal protein L19 [Candidatus Omnitrophota bacterium]